MGLFQKRNQTSRTRLSPDVVRKPNLMQGQDEYSFRRSRTLTGSASSEVKAASESKAQLKSPRLKEHELRAHRRKLGIGLVAFVCLAGLLYWLLTQFTARITTITFAPTPVTAPNTSTYTEVIQEYLRGRPLERFAFSLNEQRLSEYVQEKLPEVASVAISNDAAIGSSGFAVTLRTPVVGWRVQSRQYFVDGDGVSFERNAYASPSVTIKDESGATPQNGGAIASQRFLGFVGRVVSLTNASGAGKVAQVTIPAGTARSISVGLRGKGYAIKMHIDRDPAAQVEDMKLAMRYLKAHQITPKYIDVRVAGKAYYR